MNFFEAIEEIKKKLIGNNYPGLADEILELQISGGTGGEVLISVCSKLLEIKRRNKAAFKEIEDDTKALIEYAHSLNLFPKSS